MNRRELAGRIDHTLLTATATSGAVRELCEQAREHGMAAVCVAPIHVALAAGVLARSEVRVCTVIGFPLGSSHGRTKLFEARRAVDDGAAELDVVAALARIAEGDATAVTDELAAIVEAADGRPVKAIVEAGAWNPDELALATRAAIAAGVAFVKTSTGFGPPGATPEIVARLRALCPSKVRIKASGGIRDATAARALIEAGADRLGCSASLAILREWSA